MFVSVLRIRIFVSSMFSSFLIDFSIFSLPDYVRSQFWIIWVNELWARFCAYVELKKRCFYCLFWVSEVGLFFTIHEYITSDPQDSVVSSPLGLSLVLWKLNCGAIAGMIFWCVIQLWGFFLSWSNIILSQERFGIFGFRYVLVKVSIFPVRLQTLGTQCFCLVVWWMIYELLVCVCVWYWIGENGVIPCCDLYHCKYYSGVLCVV